MKIYSWNMYYQNPDLDRAFSFIANEDFDVFCLQEVSEQFLERLKTLPLNIAHADDIVRVEYGRTWKNQCVILARNPIALSHAIDFPDISRPWRTRLFQRMMWGLQDIKKRGSLYADIETEVGRLRVFCLHLTLSYPERIMNEFDLAMRSCEPQTRTIVCGDLNSLESPHITALYWLAGGKLRDIFAWRSTRRKFQETFARLELQNPLRGTHTQKIALSQLDHILVPQTVRIVKAEVLPDRCGSDHNPVFVEFEVS